MAFSRASMSLPAAANAAIAGDTVMLTRGYFVGLICSVQMANPRTSNRGVDDGKTRPSLRQTIGTGLMDRIGALQGAAQTPSRSRASMRTACMMHARGRSALAAADRCCVLGAWSAHPPHDCGRCRAEVACLASYGDAAATTSTATRVTDALEAQPDPSYEAGGQWTSRHYKKAQVWCQSR